MNCKYLETKEQGREAFSTNLPVSFFPLSLGTTLRVQNSPISSTLFSSKWPIFFLHGGFYRRIWQFPPKLFPRHKERKRVENRGKGGGTGLIYHKTLRDLIMQR